MAKFRSWNEKEKRFYYWQDGYYYPNIGCATGDGCYLCNDNNFNWQNAEQCYAETKVDSIYRNDIGVIEYEVEPYHFNGEYITTKQIKGVIGIDVFQGLYVEKNNRKYYVKDYKDCFFLSIGNIHEGAK